MLIEQECHETVCGLNHIRLGLNGHVTGSIEAIINILSDVVVKAVSDRNENA